MTSALPKPQKKIELFSGNYFAACTLGGIIGMQQLIHRKLSRILTNNHSLRPYSHRRHSS
jgi:hypothetical protein